MKKIRIVHTNDIHSSYDVFLRMSSVIRSLTNENTLLLDAGDFNDYSSIVTKGSNGFAGLKLLNILNYSALTIGNNEGFQNVEVIEQSANYNLVNILSCNLLKIDKTHLDGVKPSIIKDVNGIRFLIIGASPYHESYNEYYVFHNLIALDPHQIIKNEIEKYKGQYDCVIFLSHLGFKSDILLTQYVKGIDIVIAGHSHHATNIIYTNGCYMHQSGSRGSRVGYIDIVFDDNKKILSVSGENIEITDKIEEDYLIKQEYEKQKEASIKNLQMIKYEIPFDLNGSVENESNLTNMLADYLLNHYDGELSLLNSGLTLCNLKKGTISEADFIADCSSPLNIATCNIKGSVLKEAFILSTYKEKCYDSHRRPGYRSKYLGKLHVSHNCKIYVSNHEVTVYINGVLLDENKKYKVITTDYFTRGMGYEVLKANSDATLFKDYVLDSVEKALKDPLSFKYVNEKRWKER